MAEAGARRPAGCSATSGAKRDPIELLASAQEATNFALAEIRSEQNHANDRLIDQLEKINDELRNIRQEVVVAREVYAKRS